jgi:hypothetical protein
MKNLVNSTRTYERKIERTFKEGNLISEIEIESESSENIYSTEFRKTYKKSKFFNKFLDLILKSEGLISFCCYLKEPLIFNFLNLTAISIGKLLMIN